jgi:hypothetical protein
MCVRKDEENSNKDKAIIQVCGVYYCRPLYETDINFFHSQ